jgi:F1F0 ATPase subunit 2
MVEMLTLLLVTGAGLMLGTAYFGSLWWTIRKGLTSKHPAFLFLASLLLRMSLTLAVFYFIADGRLKLLLMCLLGFVIGRFIMVRLVDLSVATSSAKTTIIKGENYASEP